MSLNAKRIVVVGVCGSGKTTFAQKLGAKLNSPVVELDALHWEANWTEVDQPLFEERINKALSGSSWVVDGNYNMVREIVWGKAETVVWLDFSPAVVFSRLISRTLSRLLTKETLWAGNRESWKTQFLSRDSIFLWAFNNYKRYQSEYAGLLKDNSFPHLQLIRLRNPKQAEQWLKHC